MRRDRRNYRTRDTKPTYIIQVHDRPRRIIADVHYLNLMRTHGQATPTPKERLEVLGTGGDETIVRNLDAIEDYFEGTQSFSVASV